MHLKIITLSDMSQMERMHVVLFFLYKIIENAK